MNNRADFSAIFAATVAMILAVLFPSNAQAGTPAIALSGLNGINGFKMDGQTASERSGVSVSGIGDLNGDGIDDLAIGALADSAGTNSGRVYILFGRVDGFAGTAQLASLDGSRGFRIEGSAAGANMGASVSAAGDVNGDGLDDLFIGAPFSETSMTETGSAYVVFGRAGGFPASIALADLDGNNGFRLLGEAPGDRFGIAVSAAGDVNSDGVDDLVVGADRSDGNGDRSGRSYVLFGRLDGFPATVDLAALNGLDGFKVNGEGLTQDSGFSVSAAGDFNGDGIADVIIGAPFANSLNVGTGRAYVVFGRQTVFESIIQLAELNSSSGVVLNGENNPDQVGAAVSAAGDINGDGIGDVVVGAPVARPRGEAGEGRSYVVFGRTQPFSGPLEMAALNGVNGFKLDGGLGNSLSGYSVSGAGDVNGDGLDDLLIGAYFNNRAYVVFGRSGPFPSVMLLSQLDGESGVALVGEFPADSAGFSVGSAGDVNGDGVGDILVGAPAADPNGSSSGRSYVVFGTRETILADGFEN